MALIDTLRQALYRGADPYLFANDLSFVDTSFPYTRISEPLINEVMDRHNPRLWVEFGSMYGGSAIRVADVIRRREMDTVVLCVDPFCGDAAMWLDHNRTGIKPGLDGRPTIRDRFLATVRDCGHRDTILPFPVTTTVACRVLRKLRDDGALPHLADVVYLDSAHEPDETLVELHSAWSILEPNGLLFGDDWDWSTVRGDVRKFAAEIDVDIRIVDHYEWLLPAKPR